MRVSDIIVLGGNGGRGIDEHRFDERYLFKCQSSNSPRECFGRQYDRFDGEFNGGLRNESFTRGRGFDLVTG